MEIDTTSEEVLTAIDGIWGRYPCLNAAKPIRLRIDVSASAFDPNAESDQSHITFDKAWMWIDHGPDSTGSGNYARGNFDEGWGEIHLTADRAADAAYVNYHFAEPLAYLLLAPHHFAFVHAACVSLNGHAFTLCGEAEAGKTCLAYACARRGWTFLSGDATHFLHEGDDFPTAGRPYSIRFRESARNLFPELQSWPSALRPNRKKSIEVDTDQLNMPFALRARASHIVFLERRAGSTVKVEPVSTEEAALRLDETVFFGGEAIRESQRATLRRFASRPAIRLTYSDLDQAEAALRMLIPC